MAGDGWYPDDARRHHRIDCIRSSYPKQLAFSEQWDGEEALSFVPGSLTPARPLKSYEVVGPAPSRKTEDSAPPRITEEVPLPSAVWLAVIGFSFAGSALRRKRA